MEGYLFYQDVKVELWQRQYFTIFAENEKEAIGKVSDFKMKDVSNEMEIDSYETLAETEVPISPEENDGQRTIELYLYKGNRFIGGNVE